jgi:hypothetical protein
MTKMHVITTAVLNANELSLFDPRFPTILPISDIISDYGNRTKNFIVDPYTNQLAQTSYCPASTVALTQTKSKFDYLLML